jgi:hypothetical protein
MNKKYGDGNRQVTQRAKTKRRHDSAPIRRSGDGSECNASAAEMKWFAFICRRANAHAKADHPQRMVPGRKEADLKAEREIPPHSLRLCAFA